MYHCYLIPYMIFKNKIYILVGRKLCYSSKDGFIHNNPGQFVFIGGHCRKNKDDDKLIKSAIREFVEETGNYVNKKHMHLYRHKDYSVTFYKVVSNSDYVRYSKLNKKHIEKYKEISSLKWITLDNALKLMNPKNKLNKHGINVDKYIMDWRNKDWKLTKELHTFRKYLSKKLNRKVAFDEYNQIINDIKMNGKKSRYYTHLKNNLEKYIKEKSYIDWFHDMGKRLQTNFNKIDAAIIQKKSPKNSQQSPKSPQHQIPIKKSPKKISPKKASVKKSPKAAQIRPKPKAYIRPQLKKSPKKSTKPKAYVRPQLRKKSPKKSPLKVNSSRFARF